MLIISVTTIYLAKSTGKVKWPIFFHLFNPELTVTFNVNVSPRWVRAVRRELWPDVNFV